MSEQAKPQAEKFKELARELGADEDEAHFEDAVRKIAGSPGAAPKGDTHRDE
jgi:hypothetical protein